MSVPVLSRLFGACRRTVGRRPTAPAAALHWPPLRAPTNSTATIGNSSVRQFASSQPASGGSPTGPALRANPSPEVTDLFCRLPLPTLFYRPEAVHLGDLLRIWVRPGTRATEALPRIFKGRRQRTGRHLKCGARPGRGAYLRPTRFQARGPSRRKDNSSRDCRRRLRVRSRCRHRPEGRLHAPVREC